MQIVIDIDDHKYTQIKEDAEKFRSKGMVVPHLYKVIESGVSLPKGHGRLIDADALNRKDVNCANVPMNFIDTAPTIIEADKEYEVEVVTRGNCMICGKGLTEGLFFCKECEDKASSRK